ncbi:putative ribonuclease H-like domain-containing protein [Tanacetum coccineum]
MDGCMASMKALTTFLLRYCEGKTLYWLRKTGRYSPFGLVNSSRQLPNRLRRSPKKESSYRLVDSFPLAYWSTASPLKEEVYVYQSLGFEDPNFPDKRGPIDKTLFIKRDQGDIRIVQVYVDDIIFGSTKKKLCTEFEKMTHKKFQMSSMKELIFFLGLQVKQKEDGIFISQDKYVIEILKKFGFSYVKTANIPMETYKPLLKDADEHMYRSMIGLLMYLTSSKPDIMFADLPFDLVAYTDSDYARASLDRKSTTGEAEYVAASSCYGQVLWIQNQLLDYRYNFTHTKIYIDNESTICIVKNPVFHSKTTTLRLDITSSEIPMKRS